MCLLMPSAGQNFLWMKQNTLMDLVIYYKIYKIKNNKLFTVAYTVWKSSQVSFQNIYSLS